MPRTKVSRNTKRNRDAAKDEALSGRLREFDSFVDQYLTDLDLKHKQRFDANRAVHNVIRMLPQKILQMTVGELMSLDARTIEEANVVMEIKSTANRSVANSSMLMSTKKKSRDDEGYLTEDSATNVNTTTSSLNPFTSRAAPKSARPPGPLSSAKAKTRTRRSQSACGYLSTISSSSSIQSSLSSSTTKAPNTAADRKSRSKARPLLPNRMKAFSADRAAPVTPKVGPNTPLSILRYPRIGETVISLSGSPVVCQSISADSTANVNIPMRNGVLSVRPTRIESLDTEFIHRIDSETLNQIKQLQSNLNIIMSIADKAYSDYNKK